MTANKKIDGGPTKRFFVSMLPRDIDMDDAILDLIDNSVDGAMRNRRNHLKAERPYDGFHCKLQITDTGFRLSDNCGGIPDTYLETAFRLGRPSIDLDGDLPTIGMYGIGMKRAIFKMATEATVTSRSDDQAIQVHYTKEWLNPDSDVWELPFEKIEENDERGVDINVASIKAPVAKLFRKDRFIDTLVEKIGQHFAYIIGKGFEIEINGDPVVPETVHLLMSEQVEPYDYESEKDGVAIKVIIGFYRGLTRQAELEEAVEVDEADIRRPSVDQAGLTVICNDRVVLISDTTSITGWGLGSVPRYHPQFRAISGMIIFYSEDAKELPISTTKRDLDTDTDIYNEARNAAMEGLKLFISFTNRWKGSEEVTNKYLADHEAVEARTISLATDRGTVVRGSQGRAKRFIPELPVPERGERRRRVAFSRSIEEVQEMGEALLGDSDAKPSDIGVAAWEDTLNRVRAS